MYTGRPPLQQRVGAGLGTGVVVGAVAWMLLLSLSHAQRGAAGESLTAVTVVPLEEPPPVVVPERKPSNEPEGEAAPPNIRSTPTEVTAPAAIALIPPPIPAATVSGTGVDASAGAADLPGPGQGAGGLGDGRGSGGAGDGTGGGLGEESPPRRIRGSLSFADAARVAGWEQVVGRSMTTRFVVGVDGRASECRVTRSSGLADLDAAVCRLIEQRFRYRPSRDARGQAIRAGVEMDHYWDQQF